MAAAIARIRSVAAAVLVVLAGTPATAATLRVESAGRFATVASALAAASNGDTVRVTAGTYTEHGLLVDKTIVLQGEPGAVIDGRELGEIITVTAAGTIVRGLTLRNVGVSFTEDRSAIRVRRCSGVQVERNHLERAFFGIYAEHCDSIVIRDNMIDGPNTRETMNGNGIHLWYTTRARVANNHITGHRDGIYLEFVENSVLSGNVSVHNQRYGLHFMFSHHDDYFDNRFSHNGAGVAVMYTHNVRMGGNVFEDNWGPSAYGLLLKDINDSEIRGNTFGRNTVGLYAEGCNRLAVSRNSFLGNGYAVRIMANAMDNEFTGNRFLNNSFDVVTNSRQNFSTFDSNYWGDYRGYDLDRDGVGDVPYHPVRLFALLVEQTPPGVILMNSLFVSLIDTAERVMPVFTPESLVDARPLMNDPGDERPGVAWRVQ